ncbi:hypothetical protein [Mucilaginibacter sp.]
MKTLSKLPQKTTKTLFTYQESNPKQRAGRKETDPTNTFTLTTTHIYVK